MSERDESVLRARVRRAYAEREAAYQPLPFQDMWARAEDARPRWAPVGPVAGLAAAGVAALAIVLLWPAGEAPPELDDFTRSLTTQVSWRSPTDALAELAPPEEPLSTLPQIELPQLPVEWPATEDRS